MESVTKSNGFFMLDDVVYIPAEGWPVIMFEHEGFLPEIINIKELIDEKKVQIIDEDKNKQIIFTEDIELPKIGEEK